MNISGPGAFRGERKNTMKKIINGYEFCECTAIAVGIDNDRQKALFVHKLDDEFRDGDAVVFGGYGLPEDADDASAIFEDYSVLDFSEESLATVELI